MTRITESEYARILRQQEKPRKAATTLPGPSEHEIQCAVVEWANVMAGRCPELNFLHHSPNGYARSKAVGAQVKRAGTRAGFPDLILLCARGGWNGLAIELKTKDGHTSPMQDVWLENLRKEGYFVSVCRSANEAIDAITQYLAMS